MGKDVSTEEVTEVLNKESEEQSADKQERVDWAELTKEVASRPGSELLTLLYQRANEQGLQFRELAAALNVTYGYLYQLKVGLREVSEVSDEFVNNCAGYLNKPRLDILSLLGKSI
jgi:hypothetical protein